MEKSRKIENKFLNKTSVFTVLIIFSMLMQSAFQKADSKMDKQGKKLDYPSYFGNKIYENEANPLTEEGVALGRMLFYEKALSANGNVSCGTCHQQKLAFTDGKRFSEGTDGVPTKRNAMALVNLLWVNNFFWDGRVKGIEHQALIPLTDPHEMGQAVEVSAQKLQAIAVYPPKFKAAFGTDKITGQHITYALAQFERTLISANSRYDQYLQGDYQPTASELRGIALFFGSDDQGNMTRQATCGHCHGGPKTFSELFHNNGLDVNTQDIGRGIFTGLPADNGRFRVVTLRNIALTAPYMHDGRFTSLEEVIDHYSDGIKTSQTLSPFLQIGKLDAKTHGFRFTEQEKKDIVHFLHLLTDSGFVHNPLFSDPFLNN